MRKSWQTYGKEIVRYSKNCDFIGNDFGQMDDIDSTDECIEKCRETSDCTHFMYDFDENTCFLKKEGADKMKQSFAKKKSCGYFPDRGSKTSQTTSQPTQTSQPTKASRSTMASQPTETAQTASQPTRTSQPTKTSRSTMTSQPTTTFRPTKPSQPTTTSQPTTASQPTPTSTLPTPSMSTMQQKSKIHPTVSQS